VNCMLGSMSIMSGMGQKQPLRLLEIEEIEWLLSANAVEKVGLA